MADALGYTATIRVLTGIEVDGARHDVLSSASGTVITSPGFRLAYQEGRDQGRYDAEKNDAEKTLPDVAEGDPATLTEATPDGHETQPPGRYTEATLVKTMEELGIGRPSTYAATIQTIGDRGYVTHRGQYLVPTWLAFSVTRLLEENLANLVDYDFTASMEGDLDRIAAGEENGTDFLTGFFFGPDGTGENGGLRHDVASLGDDIDARAVNSIDLGRGVTLRVGRYGPYMEKADGTRANVPPEVAPDELTDELIDQLFSRAADDGRELGVDPATGHTIIVKDGRYGPYVTEVLPEAAEGAEEGAKKTKKSAVKPRTASLFKTMDIATVTLEDALNLLSLPREVGTDPASGEVITAQNGRYGPYLKKGTDSRTLASEDQLLTITLDEALAIYAQPKTRGRGTARPPLREFGEDPISGKKVTVKDGRFGPYVTDGETNVTVPRAETVEDLTAERAYELLADKRAKGPAPKRTRKTAAKKTTTKKTTAAKKTRRRPREEDGRQEGRDEEGQLMAARGVFITFEGGDGSGKSTQIQSVRDWFESRGREVIVTREPGGTELGTEIRRLVQNGPEDVDARTEALLYAADRAYHVATVIAPALERGAVVLGDRYIDSSLAYQGAARSLGVDEIASLSAWATRGLYPSLTFLLDLPPEVGARRRTDAPDRMERESMDFHERVRHEYLRLADAEPDRIVVIDAVGTVDEVFSEIRGVLVERFEGGSVTIDEADDAPVSAPAQEAPASSSPEALREGLREASSGGTPRSRARRARTRARPASPPRWWESWANPRARSGMNDERLVLARRTGCGRR